jgi:mono/diheme cytochrome c family protein
MHEACCIIVKRRAAMKPLEESSFWPPDHVVSCHRRARQILLMEQRIRKTRTAPILAAGLSGMLALAMSLGCDIERRKSDAELGLNPQQAAGRKIYDTECARCHEPYSTRAKKGPGLKGMFQGKYLAVSGMPANDERVTDIIRLGRKDMPGYSQKFSDKDLQDLLAYLHTL